MNLISVKNIKLGYGNNTVIDGLSFDIDDRDFICIVGPNGSGKSTLIKGILGLISPISGKIVFNNTKQKYIGYMPQETAVDSNFPASVFEIVLSGSLNESNCFYSEEIKKRADEILNLLNIKRLKDESFCELSGGQRQKVLLARALMSTKKLLILDEPSNNLDQKSKQSLYELIEKLNKEKEIAIVMITHDLDHNNLVGDKILSLRDNDYFFGSTKEFIERVHHE
jgi:zinc transport system ATP-binding protein